MIAERRADAEREPSEAVRSTKSCSCSYGVICLCSLILGGGYRLQRLETWSRYASIITATTGFPCLYLTQHARPPISALSELTPPVSRWWG
jgi:hypothetical protein